MIFRKTFFVSYLSKNLTYNSTSVEKSVIFFDRIVSKRNFMRIINLYYCLDASNHHKLYHYYQNLIFKQNSQILVDFLHAGTEKFSELLNLNSLKKQTICWVSVCLRQLEERQDTMKSHVIFASNYNSNMSTLWNSSNSV